MAKNSASIRSSVVSYYHDTFNTALTTQGEELMSELSDACVTVAKGGVGESGGSSLLLHTVAGESSKMMVLRNTNTSLCGNQWGVATLFVNGIPAATGNISEKDSSIQAEAAPGAGVAAVIHAIPNFNKIQCVRLGELSVQLDECELVNVADKEIRTGGVVSCSNIATRNWYAWNKKIPPLPDSFHVVGEVQVANPGVDAILVPTDPQGFSQEILLLDLLLIQRPGNWPQRLTWTTARYDKVNVNYNQVDVAYNKHNVAVIAVDVVQ